MASIINVDQINEATSGNGVQIPGHMVQIVQGISTTYTCLLYTSPSPRDVEESRMPSSA